MDDKYIEDWVEMLHSPDANERYIACVRLRIASKLTSDAIEALQQATSDPDTGVAEAAKRVLDFHLTPQSTTKPPSPEPSHGQPSVEPPAVPFIGPEVLQPVLGRHLDWKEVWIKALTNPSTASYQEILIDPGASKNRGVWWIIITALIYTLIRMLINETITRHTSSVFGDNASMSVLTLGVVCFVPVSAAFVVLGFYLDVGIMNTIAKLMGGQDNFDKLFYIFSAIGAPMLLINGLIANIPYVKFLIYLTTLYTFVLYIVAIMTVFKFSVGRAIVTCLIPTTIGIILGIGYLIFLAS